MFAGYKPTLSAQRKKVTFQIDMKMKEDMKYTWRKTGKIFARNDADSKKKKDWATMLWNIANQTED